jgi:flagellar hook-associated protein FlgK
MGKGIDNKLPSPSAKANVLSNQTSGAKGIRSTAKTAEGQLRVRAFNAPPSRRNTQAVQSKDMSAGALVQQLSEINRRMESAASSGLEVDDLIQRRDALVGELEQNSAIDVVHRPDGTVRIRTTEGRVLLGSTVGEAGELGHSILQGASSETAEVSLEQYQQMSGGETSGVSSTDSISSAVSKLAELPRIQSVESLQGKVAVLTQMEEAFTESSESLENLTSRQDDITRLLG